MKLRYANNNEIPARSICHVSRERDVLGLIALRKHDTQQLFLICVKKKSICNLHVIDMPWNEQTISVSLFFLTIQFTDRRARLTAIQPYILGLHCHAMKNENANYSIQKD